MPLRVYFVRHLPNEWPERNVAQQFRVELIDKYGRATAWGKKQQNLPKLPKKSGSLNLDFENFPVLG